MPIIFHSLAPNFALQDRSNSSITFNFTYENVPGFDSTGDGLVYAYHITATVRSGSTTKATYNFSYMGMTMYGSDTVNETISFDTLFESYSNNELLNVRLSATGMQSDLLYFTVRQAQLTFGSYASNLLVNYNGVVNMPAPTNVPVGYLANFWTANSTNFNFGVGFTPSSYPSWWSGSYIRSFTLNLSKITYNITINNNSGSGGAIDTSTYQINSSTQLRNLTLPTRVGWSFAGWSVSTPTAGSITVLSYTQIRINAETYGNFTLTANWYFPNEGLSYNVIVEAHSQADVQAQTPIYYANSEVASTFLVETENIALGWSLYSMYISRHSPNGGPAPTIGFYEATSGDTFLYEVNIPATSWGDFEIVPAFEPIWYSISYLLSGGTGVHGNVTSYNITSSIINLVQGSLTRTGYTFKGWFTASSGGTQVTDIPTGTTGNKTYYAQWEVINYDITYALNGSTAFPASRSSSNNPNTYNILSSSITFVTTDFSRAGFDCSGLTPATITAGSTGTKNINVGWNAITYTITRNDNGGSGMVISSLSYNSGNVNGSSTTRTITTVPTRPGYTLSSYTIIRVEGSGGSAPTISGTIITIPSGSYGDFTIRANWSGNTNSYSFTSNGDTDTGNWITQSTPREFIYNLNSKTGYYGNGGEITTQTNGGNTTLTGTNSLTITAPGEAYGTLVVQGLYNPNPYTVKFNSNGGSVHEDLAATYDAALGVLPSPTRPGYNFDGWYFETGLTNLVTSASMNLTSTYNGQKTIYAKWTTRILTVNYTHGGGTGTMTASAGSYDGNILVKANSFTRTGYTFNGWSSSDNSANTVSPLANTEYLVNDLSSTITDTGVTAATITLTAQWVINQYTITFVSNGGTATTNITQEYNTSVVKPVNPTRLGYTFLNWYTDIGLTNIQTWPFNMPLDGKSLYAGWQINQYTITFVSNGGSSINSITQSFGTNVTQPSNPTRAGYNFGGWYSDVIFEHLYIFSTMPAQNISLYARWLFNYTLQFVDHDGTVLKSGLFNSDDDTSGFTAPTNPTRVGYTFTGWSQTVPATMPANNVIINAQYTINQYVVSFEENNGSEVFDITQNYNTSVAKPTNPTRTGYTFDNWYTNVGLTTVRTWPFNMPASNTTLYAKWNINQYTISFTVNGGTSIANITQDFNSVVSAPSNPTRTGYTFNGWFSDTLLTQAYSFTTMPANNLTLYAKWNINSYTITFNSNGGSTVSSITQNYDTNVTQPSNPTRTGYTFNGWFSDVALTIVYVFNKMPAANTTAYASWTINQYTVSFNSNEGSVVSAKTQNFNTSVTKPTNPTKTGYAFEDWFIDAALTNIRTWPFNMPANNLTLYAKWNINSYTITFNSNGGSTVTEINQEYNTSVSAPTNPTRLGYNFGGWYLDVEFAQAYNFNVMPATNVLLYAKWLIDAYTLQYVDWNGTVIQIGDYDFEFDLTTISVPTNPTRTGYTFTGWNIALPNTMPANNVTLIAQYTINQYTLTFEENGGTNVNNITQNYDTTITAPSVSRVGHTFGGWYSDEALTATFTFNKMPSSDLTLYAKWTINQYTISFVINGGSTVSNVTQDYGSALTAPSITRTGYTFNGWFNESNFLTAYNFTTMPAQNTTAYARWIINKYKVTFVTDGGTSITNLDQNYNTSITLPSITRVGHTFLGWFENEAMTVTYSHTTIPAFDTTAYAKWQINQYTIIFVSNNGSTVSNLIQDYDSTVIAPVSTRPGYNLIGWYTDVALNNLYTFNKMPAFNQTLYAKWQGITYTIDINLNGGTGETNKSFTTAESQQTRSFKVGTDMNKTLIGKKHTFSHWEITSNTSGALSILSGTTLTIPANAYGTLNVQARWNVAIRKQRVGNIRLEENKIKFNNDNVNKIIRTNASGVPEVIYEKDLYLEEV